MTVTPLGTTPILANRGSDVAISFNWKDTAGNNVDLTGWTATLKDVSSNIVSNKLTVQIQIPEQGLIFIDMQWDSMYRAGESHLFRVQLTSGDEDRSTNLIEVVYQ